MMQKIVNFSKIYLIYSNQPRQQREQNVDDLKTAAYFQVQRHRSPTLANGGSSQPLVTLAQSPHQSFDPLQYQ